MIFMAIKGSLVYEQYFSGKTRHTPTTHLDLTKIISPIPPLLSPRFLFDLTPSVTPISLQSDSELAPISLRFHSELTQNSPQLTCVFVS